MEHMVFLPPDDMVGKLYQNGRLEVIGLIAKTDKYRKYAVLCKVCGKDSELFGSGIFEAFKGNLVKNENISCGCNNIKLTEGQATIKAKRKAYETDNNFLAFDGPYKSTKTAVLLNCSKHGDWRCYSLSDFLDTKCCPKCSYEELSVKTSTRMLGNSIAKIDDNLIIDKFLSTNAFDLSTQFSRSDKVNKRNQKSYWDVFCPSCHETNTADYSALIRGSLPCSCAGLEQKEAYIKLLFENEVPIAIKFGISKDGEKRTFQGCKYTVETIGIWKFKNKQDCRSAETACLNTLICGVVDRTQMPTGYTETTSLLNLEFIINTYNKFGGLRK